MTALETSLSRPEQGVTLVSLSSCSLHTLSRCINALAKANGDKTAHVPFRESKLTRLLKDRWVLQHHERCGRMSTPTSLVRGDARPVWLATPRFD